MRLAFIAAIAATAVVAHSDSGSHGSPSCAHECVKPYTTGGQKIGGCSMFDAPCICTGGKFIQEITSCICKACDASGQQATVDFAKMMCNGVEGSNIPDTMVCGTNGSSTTTMATTATGTPTPTATTNKTVVSPTASGITSVGAASLSGPIGAAGIIAAMFAAL